MELHFLLLYRQEFNRTLLSVAEEEIELHFPKAALELDQLGVGGGHWDRQSTEQHQDGPDPLWCLVSLRSVNLTVCMMSNRKYEYRDSFESSYITKRTGFLLRVPHLLHLPPPPVPLCV